MNGTSIRARAVTPERNLLPRIWRLLLFGAGLLVLAPLALLVLPTLDPRLFMYPYGAALHLLAAGGCFHVAQRTPGKVRFQWLLLATQFVLLSLSLWSPTLEISTGWPSRRWTGWLISGFGAAAFTSLLLALTAYGVRAARYARLPDTFMTLNLCALNFLTAFSTGPSGFSEYHLQVSFASVFFLLVATEANRRTAQSAAERQFTTTATAYLLCRVVGLFLINIVDNLWLPAAREFPFDLLYGVPQLCCALLALRALQATPAPGPTQSPSPLWASFAPSMVLAASIFLALHVNRDYPLLCGLSISISVVCFILRTNLIYQSMLREQQELVARTGHLETLASHDVLTGIGNRRWLEETAFKLLQTGPVAPAALLLIDTDRFKWINDTFGHHAGDKLLTAIGRTLRDEMSVIEGACCARIGGDEFAALLPHAGPEVAAQAAEQFRRRIEKLPSEDGNCHASVSIGIAVTSGRVALTSLLELADEALYAAKRRGRNAIDLAEEDAIVFSRRGSHSENRIFRSAAQEK